MDDEEGLPVERSTYLSSMKLLQSRGFDGSTFLDIGAAEGAFYLWRRQLDLFPRARHFFIDAMQENEEIYRRIGARFGTGYEIAALSKMEGQVSLRIDPDFYNTHIDQLQPGTKFASTRQVPLATLDAVVERHKLEPPFLLKLDVQGAELDVLRGAPQTLERAVIVTAEIQIFNARETLPEALDLMRGLGWALYDITDQGYYPSDESLCQVYATFIPLRLDFRKDSVWCLPHQEEAVLSQLRQRRARVVEAVEEVIRNG
jgi:FkbM family methyltransferase